MARDMPFALLKKIMTEVSGHIQSRISHICDKVTVFAGLFMSPLPQYL